jgi:hypothetical protein
MADNVYNAIIVDGETACFFKNLTREEHSLLKRLYEADLLVGHLITDNNIINCE